eukprot:scaffold404908_cov41-Prasinocladus_malaysianus.AAC.1
MIAGQHHKYNLDARFILSTSIIKDNLATCNKALILHINHSDKRVVQHAGYRHDGHCANSGSVITKPWQEHLTKQAMEVKEIFKNYLYWTSFEIGNKTKR